MFITSQLKSEFLQIRTFFSGDKKVVSPLVLVISFYLVWVLLWMLSCYLGVKVVYSLDYLSANNFDGINRIGVYLIVFIIPIVSAGLLSGVISFLFFRKVKPTSSKKFLKILAVLPLFSALYTSSLHLLALFDTYIPPILDGILEIVFMVELLWIFGLLPVTFSLALSWAVVFCVAKYSKI